jgi:alpha-tubulin suppressor-like RCC1 family protein
MNAIILEQAGKKYGFPVPSNGKSAYQLWLEAGHAGSLSDFLESLKVYTTLLGTVASANEDGTANVLTFGSLQLINSIQFPGGMPSAGQIAVISQQAGIWYGFVSSGNSEPPLPPITLTNVAKILAEGNSTSILLLDGTLCNAGENEEFQLGRGSNVPYEFTHNNIERYKWEGNTGSGQWLPFDTISVLETGWRPKESSLSFGVVPGVSFVDIANECGVRANGELWTCGDAEFANRTGTSTVLSKTFSPSYPSKPIFSSNNPTFSPYSLAGLQAINQAASYYNYFGRVLALSNIKFVEKNIVIDHNGILYTKGANKYGTLGRPASDVVWEGEPSNELVSGFIIYGDKNYGAVPGIAAKQATLNLHGTNPFFFANNLYIVTTSGELYTAGYEGEMLCRGGSSGTPEATNLAQVTGLPAIKMISANSGSVAAVGENGSLWIGGNSNNYHQLGKDSTGYLTQIPNFTVKSVSCGQEHTAVIDENDNLWMAGNNNYGQLCVNLINGTETPEANGYFYKVPNVKAKGVSCGCNHTVVLMLNGQVWTAGRNDWQQLCRKNAFSGSETVCNFGQVDNPSS